MKINSVNIWNVLSYKKLCYICDHAFEVYNSIKLGKSNWSCLFNERTTSMKYKWKKFCNYLLLKYLQKLGSVIRKHRLFIYWNNWIDFDSRTLCNLSASCSSNNPSSFNLSSVSIILLRTVRVACLVFTATATPGLLLCSNAI